MGRLAVADARRPLLRARFRAGAPTGYAKRVPDPGGAADPAGVAVGGPGPSLLFQRGEPLERPGLYLDLAGGPCATEVAGIAVLGATVRDVHDHHAVMLDAGNDRSWVQDPDG